jgi:hypothetical protein
MRDSGCAKSVIRKDVFESIPGYKDIPVMQLKNVFVKSRSGQQERISGHAALKISFEGDKTDFLKILMIKLTNCSQKNIHLNITTKD